MTSTWDTEPTRDAFLGGRVSLFQPRDGYRAGMDAVLLAASVQATPGQTVLELGCGVGAAALCLAARVPGVSLTGVEIQPAYAALARRNAEANRAAFDVVEGDLARLPAHLRQVSFDHVIMNPPYFDPDLGTGSADPGRDTALRGATPASAWIDAGLRRLAPKGWLTLIQRVDRLPDMLRALDGRIGSVCVAPLAARAGRPPHLFVMQGKKGGRARFRMTAPVILHTGPSHERDAEDYTAPIAAALRDGAELRIWD
ncbi:tRNA1(Val) (adenine(37)-N6)-methyltransferase [Roseisalinus antarcticus]|uniref:N5-glutamine S-adenosyl-L-methionine-dependent methyltransferase n=1 Tax=Roseisalinus antarcticus TaxID=254357 RepID=A0A1Y5RN13_9RHOB|nr:methyltransferase [Roseisalinus antarcticus]SLN21258.1 N5-glutamine S-adenosyl-L-methionine-dependent methyltransferase [Roseisalinus antarcticus]